MYYEIRMRGITAMRDTSGPIQAGARRIAGINKYSRSIRRILVLTLAAAVSLLAAAQHADAASGPISNPHIIAHLDFSRGQTPENLSLEPDGSADVTFAEAAQVARVSLDGQVRILAQLPAPTGGAACPFLGPFLGKAALTTGIVRDHHGSLYVALCTGSPDLQGIWRVSVADGTVVAWALGPQLAPNGFLGANGLKLHGGAVWVSNTQHGTLLRIPIRADGSAGPIETIAGGLAGIDDFAFTGPGQSASVLAAINAFSTVVLIRPDGSEQTVLTAADGLSNPSSVAIRGSTVYVLSAAYLTHNDPNVLLASLHR